MLKYSLCCIFVLVVGQASYAKELPAGYKRCKFGSEFRSCVLAALNDALPKIADGYKQLGIPQLEPFFIKHVKVNSGGPVAINQDYMNVNIPSLLSNTTIDDFQIDMDQHEMTFVVKKPIFDMTGDYKITGRVLILPIEGQGKFQLQYTNLLIKQKFKYEESKKNGETFWRFISVETMMETEKMRVHFENLFNGNKELGDTMNKFINENWQDIFKEVEPEYSKIFSSISLKTLNKFFSQYSVSKLFG